MMKLCEKARIQIQIRKNFRIRILIQCTVFGFTNNTELNDENPEKKRSYEISNFMDVFP